MKLIIYCIVLLPILSCSVEDVNNEMIVSETRSKSMKELKKFSVAFYNVENLFDTEDDPLTSDDDFTPDGAKEWNEERYRKKIKNISAVIKGIDDKLPLFVGLCEVENEKVLKDLTLTEKLRKANYKIVHYDSPDTRGIDVGLIYKSDYFSVLETASLEVFFEDTPEVLTRDILYVKGELNNEIIHLFVNHWSSRRKGEKETEYKRITAAEVLKSKIEAIQEEERKAKILIMGDFNDYPMNRSIKDVLEASLQPESDEFYNLATRLDQKEEGTHFYDDEWGMLDQMMISNSWLSSKKGNVLKKKTVKVYKDDAVLFHHKKFGGIPNKTYGGDQYYGGFSDHLAIYLEFELKK
ncbi:MAG: endonuclease [Flavobacteriales bacterium]|jgi:predicted extracellular nuclease|nr:endonuclease [Flavobacteriales bacterium]